VIGVLKKALSAVVLLLVAIAVMAQSMPFAYSADANVAFSDHFDGTAVDPTKWNVQNNTDLSGYPAYGGLVQVSDSYTYHCQVTGQVFPV
jgi:hypothetical protein